VNELLLSPWRRNQAAVTVATFIGFTGFTLVMPFLPIYFQDLGVRDTGAIAIWAGLSLGVTPAITAVMTPIWARLADRVGHKLMMERSLASFVVIMVLTAIVRAPWQVLALRAVQGVFAGYGPLAMMLAAESSPLEHMSAAIGWVQTAQRLGPALGPLIGGVLAQAVGLRATFVVAAGFYLCGFLFVALGYRESGVRRERERGEPPASWRTLRQVRHFVLFVGIIFGLQLVDRSFGPILPLYLGEVGQPAGRVAFLTGIIFTVAAATAALGNQVSGRLAARVPCGLLVPAAALVAAFGAAVFGAAAPASGLLAAAVVFGLGMGVATTVIYTEAGHSVERSARGVAFGYLQTAYLVGLAVSPIAAGLLGARSMRAVFWADGATLAAVAVLVSWRMAATDRRD
jgi:MFS transporter, DHA1 family, multidrug resistance protein